jgi:glutamate N-acetyltransferase/amino-acid N-acetyltransferase
VVASDLVKAAVHGADPNWGRIVAAAGNAVLPIAAILEAAGLDAASARARAGQPVPLESDGLRVAIAGTFVFEGAPVAYDDAELRARMRADEVHIELQLGQGDGRGEAFGCDLTEAYVVENSAYST